MISKMPRFKVSFGYALFCSEDELRYGKLEEKIMTFNDIEFFLKILSPMNSFEWVNHLKLLKRGMNYILNFDETTNGKTMKKYLKIVRN